MKYIKWKPLIITCIVCLLPIFLGLALWDSLPDSIAIHFNFNNEPDNFVSKGLSVYGLPVMMAVLQIVCCIINDANANKHSEYKKLENVTKWIIPVISIVLQAVTLGYNLGLNIDIRKTAVLIIGIILLVTGKYMRESDYVKNHDIEPEIARKINRFIGSETVIMGILALVTICLPPIATVVWIFLLIPYAVISTVYTIKKGR